MALLKTGDHEQVLYATFLHLRNRYYDIFGLIADQFRHVLATVKNANYKNLLMVCVYEIPQLLLDWIVNILKMAAI